MRLQAPLAKDGEKRDASLPLSSPSPLSVRKCNHSGDIMFLLCSMSEAFVKCDGHSVPFVTARINVEEYQYR